MHRTLKCTHMYIHSVVQKHYYFSVFMLCFPLSLSIFLRNSNILTCPQAPGKMCCHCFSSFCHSRHAPKWPPRLYRSLSLSLSLRFSSPFSITDIHIPVAIYVPWKPTFNDSSHSHFYSSASPRCYHGRDCKQQPCKIKWKCFTL